MLFDAIASHPYFTIYGPLNPTIIITAPMIIKIIPPAIVNITVNIEQIELIVTLVQQKKKDIKRIKTAK
jgi:hypothetical protein